MARVRVRARFRDRAKVSGRARVRVRVRSETKFGNHRKYGTNPRSFFGKIRRCIFGLRSLTKARVGLG